MSSSMFLAKVNQFKFLDRGYSNFPNICFTPNHEYIERVLGWKLDTREQWCHKLPKRKPQKLGTFQKMKRWNWLIADHVAPVSGSVARYESLQRFQRDETFSKNCKDKDKRKLGNKRFHTQRKLGTGGVVLHTGPGGHQINCTRQKNQLQPPNEEIKSL